MDPETLVTFMFKAPPEVRSVELLGSWDNFTRAYSMNHDRRRGRGCWTGCFKFDDIIFDGKTMRFTHPRSGGLKQGGVYWFFYRLDDQTESYDDNREYTSTCPLLPGQYLNVMEVPSEVIELAGRPSTASELSDNTRNFMRRSTSRHALEPRAKFEPLQPPPLSKIHARSVSDMALGGRLESNAHTKNHAIMPSSSSPVPKSYSRRSSSSESTASGSYCYRASVDHEYSASLDHEYNASLSIVETYGYMSSGTPSEGMSPVECLVGRSNSHGGDSSHSLTDLYCSHFSETDSTRSVLDARGCSLPSHSERREVHADEPHSITSNDSISSYSVRLEPRPSDWGLATRSMASDLPGSYHALNINQTLAELPEIQYPRELSHVVSAIPEDSSPTFSADTMSSKGVQTPLRLSGGFPRTDAVISSESEEPAEKTIHARESNAEWKAHTQHLNASQHESCGDVVQSADLSTVQINSFDPAPSTKPDYPTSTAIPLLPTVEKRSDGISMAEAFFVQLGFD